MNSLTVFSWGYWGWGNATPQLVSALDSAEAERGFAPPVCVDARISRSVRAVGFNGNAFERLLGADRYRWMPGLGNRAIQTHEGPPIQIADPAAADALLALADAARHDHRRVLFFCSCEYPRTDEGIECHRVEVGRLLVAAARRRGADLTLVEWPGGKPTPMSLEVPAKTLREVRRGRSSVPLAGTSLPDGPHGFAVGSVATLANQTDSLRVVTGPARYAADGWYLPVFHREAQSAGESPPLEEWAAHFRARRGYEPVHVSGGGAAGG